MITRKLVERRAEIERERLYGPNGDRGPRSGGGDQGRVEPKDTKAEGGKCC